MKKLLAITLCAVMTVSLAACAKQEAEAPQTETAAETAQEVKETAAPETTAAETAAEKPAETTAAEKEQKSETADTGKYTWTETPDVLHMNMVDHIEGAQDKTNKEAAKYSYQRFILTEGDEEKYPELQKALDKISEEFKGGKEQLIESLKDIRSENREEIPVLSSENYSYILRADSNLVCIGDQGYWYGGGAHPEESYFASTIDARTGDVLTIDDIVKDKAAFLDLISDRLKKEYPDSGFFEPDDPVKLYKDGEFKLQFSVAYSGVSVWFNHYEIVPYASGILSLQFPFEEYGDLFVDGIGYHPQNTAKWISTGSMKLIDGTLLTIETTSTDYGAIDSITINGNKFETRTYGLKMYAVAKDGANYLYTFENGDDDETWYEVFKIDADEVKLVGKKDGQLAFTQIRMDAEGYPEELNAWAAENTYYAFTDPDYLFLTSGKGTDGKMYKVGPDGMPAAK